MKIYIPFMGVITKSIETDVVQQFLGVFRKPQDIHRVLIVIPLTLFVSHSIFLKNQAHISVIFYDLQRSEIIWLGLQSFPLFFAACWAVFSSEFNLTLYIRQIIFVGWTCLLHRLSYGLEELGTPYLMTISFLALIFFLPYAFSGLRPDQMWNQYQEKKAEEVKKQHAAVVYQKEAA